MKAKETASPVVKGFAVYEGAKKLTRTYHCESAAKEFASLYEKQGGVCRVLPVVGIEHKASNK